MKRLIFRSRTTSTHSTAICGPKPTEVEDLARELLASKLEHVLATHQDSLPNLEQKVLESQPGTPFKAPAPVETGIVTEDTDTEGQACPLVVYRSKADQKHGGIIARKGPKARTLIWGRWWQVTPAHQTRQTTMTDQAAQETTPQSPSTPTQHRRGPT
ncbi:hypothetical protein ERJ75_000606000 [Trypanosoma vivax]|nr:hypothetical protein ERJ75_000606000 [Trypanosoma vivax]